MGTAVLKCQDTTGRPSRARGEGEEMQEVKSGLRYFFKQPVKRQGVKSVAAPSNSAGLPQRCQQLLHADTKAEQQRFQEEGLGLGPVQYVQEQPSPAKLNSFGYPLHELDPGASAPLQSLWHTGSGSCGWRQHICGDSSGEFCAMQQEGNPESSPEGSTPTGLRVLVEASAYDERLSRVPSSLTPDCGNQYQQPMGSSVRQGDLPSTIGPGTLVTPDNLKSFVSGRIAVRTSDRYRTAMERGGDVCPAHSGGSVGGVVTEVIDEPGNGFRVQVVWKYGQDQKPQPMSGYRVGYDDQFDLQAAEPPIPHPLPVCHSNEGRR